MYFLITQNGNCSVIFGIVCISPPGGPALVREMSPLKPSKLFLQFEDVILKEQSLKYLCGSQ